MYIFQLKDKSFDEYLKENRLIDIFQFKEISYNMVREKIDSLKNSTSYDFNTKIIKTIKNLIIYPLTKLFNQCIRENVFPTVLKIARVIPVFKQKGSSDDQTNYRPKIVIAHLC